MKDETIAFISKVPPFNLLSTEAIAAITDEIALEYYPKGTKILTQDGPPSEYLRVIKKGGVKVYLTSPQEDKELVIDFRSEGEQFGLLSVMSGDRSRANVVAVEDTICYLIPSAKVSSLVQTNPAANEYFLKSFLINFIDKSQDETRSKYTGLSEGERLLFTTPVGDIVLKTPITAQVDLSIQQAARVMSGHKISSLIIVDAGGEPIGIVTDRDLRLKVVAEGRSIGDAVGEIMSAPLIRVDAEEFCFEALLLMMKHKIHHVLVTQGGRMKGIVSNHDFMLLQGISPTVLVKEMEDMRSLDSLAKTTPKLYKTVETLLREGAKAQNVSGLITELAEKLVLRMAALIEDREGRAPLPYGLFLLGDGGRRELSLDMRVRVGVVYADTPNLKLAREAERFFNDFILHFNQSVAVCSPYAGRDCMAPDLVHSLSDWKDYFARWTRDPGRFPEMGDFFDMRGIGDETEPADSLRAHVLGLLAEPEVMATLCAQGAEAKLPLGFFKRFVVEKSGEHRNELDIYDKGLKPLAGAVRALSLANGVRELSTAKRIEGLGGRRAIEQSHDTAHAYEYLLNLLIHKQLKQIAEGLAPDTFINPEHLSSIERQTLKETFNLTAALCERAGKCASRSG